MNKHLPLALLAALVVAGLVALVLSLRGQGGAGAPAEPSPPAPSGDRSVRDHRGRKDPGGSGAARPAPGGTAGAGSATPTEHAVVDHRGQEVEPPEHRPTYKVEPGIIASTRLAIRPLIKRCSTEFSAEVGAEDPVLQTVLRVHVEGGELTIADLEIQTKNVPAAGDLVGCVRDGLAGFRLPVPGHRDVERHPLTFPFDLPLR